MGKHDLEGTAHMEPHVSIRAVLFDIGGVIVTDGPDMTQVASHLGLDAAQGTLTAVDSAVWAHRDAYDLGLSAEEYWTRVARDAGAAPPSPTIIGELTEQDIARWRRPRPEVIEFIREIQHAGLTLGVLSNAPVPLASGFRDQGWTLAFTALTFSCDIGVAKPHPEAYAAAVSRLGVPAGNVLFFDDREGNVVAARAAGLQAAQWRGVQSARTTMKELGVGNGG